MTRALGLLVSLLLVGAVPVSAETVSTFTLDGLSFVSFQDEEVLHFPSGSTIRFRFGTPMSNGSVPFTIKPGDVSIPEIPLSNGQRLTYGLGATVSGLMQSTPEGQIISFSAPVRATLSGGRGGSTLDYPVSFTTETASSQNRSRTKRVDITGMRLVDEARYAQIVGATANKTDAYPVPGAAVYTVLSGQFDQLP